MVNSKHAFVPRYTTRDISNCLELYRTVLLVLRLGLNRLVLQGQGFISNSSPSSVTLIPFSGTPDIKLHVPGTQRLKVYSSGTPGIKPHAPGAHILDKLY